MKIKKSVFGSPAEKQVYESLKTRWEPRFKVYHNLPLANIIELDDSDALGNWRHYFYKSTIDFTFCNRETDKPILSVEFDGIGGGFSRSGKYQGSKPTKDRHRGNKLGFKLDIAGKSGYPLIIVSFDEVRPLDTEDSLTILDSIVGQYLAFHELGSTFNELGRSLLLGIQIEATSEAALEDQPLRGWHECISDKDEYRVFTKYDPVFSEAEKYKELCINLGANGFGSEPIYETEDPNWYGYVSDDNWVVARYWVQWSKQVEVKAGGAKDTVAVKCRIDRTAAVRHFEGIEGISASYLSWVVAAYLAWKLAYHILSTDSGKNILSKTRSLDEKTYSIEGVRQTHPRAYEKWTEEEEQHVIRLTQEGLSMREIAEMLQRQPGAIRSRQRKLEERGLL
jgi:hypothetical protein